METALKLWVVLSRAQAAVAAHAEADAARHGLSAVEFGALEALYHKGPLLVGELQRAVLRSSGGSPTWWTGWRARAWSGGGAAPTTGVPSTRS